jgi:uncharacterized UPF0160 family protein
MKKIVTHSGSFHPDDVFAVATLKLYLNGEEFELLRTREPNLIEAGDFVVDVGGKYDGAKFFDHHQFGGAGRRENKVPFASFGLVWKSFGEKICDSKVVSDFVDKRLVQFVDAGDSGLGEIKPFLDEVMPFTVTDAISVLNQERDLNDISNIFVFNKAVSFAEAILINLIKRIKKIESEKFTVAEIYNKNSDKRIIIFDKNYDWAPILKDLKEVLFVVEPEDENLPLGNWKVKCVRDSLSSFVNRKDLPKEWAGLRDEELSKISDIDGSMFCHNMRFLAVNKTKEGAIKMAQKALLS